MNRLLVFVVDDPAAPGTPFYKESVRFNDMNYVPAVNDEFTFKLPTDHAKVLVVKVEKLRFGLIGNQRKKERSIVLELDCSVVNTAADAYKDYTDNV